MWFGSHFFNRILPLFMLNISFMYCLGSCWVFYSKKPVLSGPCNVKTEETSRLTSLELDSARHRVLATGLLESDPWLRWAFLWQPGIGLAKSAGLLCQNGIAQIRYHYSSGREVHGAQGTDADNKMTATCPYWRSEECWLRVRDSRIYPGFFAGMIFCSK